MTKEEALFNRFSGPAVLFSYQNGDVRIIKTNEKYPHEIGMNISGESFSGTDLLATMDTSSRSLFLSAVRDVIAGEDEKEVETVRHLFSDCCGEEKICVRTKLYLLEQVGEEYIFYATIRNITAERKSVDNLMESERRFKIASEQINIYYWEYTVATKEMRPCFRCMRDLGLPALVRNYPEPAIEAGIFPPDYADMYRDWHRQIAEGVKELEAIIPLTVGRVPFRVKYTTEFDSEGKPFKAYGSATLIPQSELDRKKLDDVIIERLADEYDCIYIVDIDADRLSVLRRTTEFVPLDIRDGIFSESVSLIKSNCSPKFAEQISLMDSPSKLRKVLTESAGRREFMVFNEGTKQWVRMYCQALEVRNEVISKVIVSFSTIDDYRAQKIEADAKIAEQNKELEKRGKQLEEAVAEANRANEVKTTFLSNMSHDIRTPMNAIMGYVNLAKEICEDNAKLSDYLEKIDISGKHLLELINDILDMSRIESGKMEINELPEDITCIFTEAHSIFAPQMASKNIHFEYIESDIRDKYVFCDRLRVSRILLNLISNAYKFTPENGSITVSLRQIPCGGRDAAQYEIRVRDTGIGMKKEFAEKIWEPFTRENNTTVNGIQGTGLGMAIVHKLVEMMGGKIDLVTEQGKGTEFTMDLTFRLADEKDARKDKEDEVSPIRKPEENAGKKLLLVEDNAVNREIAKAFLVKGGYEVIEAVNGEKAVEIVKNASPGDFELILMDVQMPVMDGYGASEKIRALNLPISGIPIVAMTANAFADDVAKALKSGMNDHIAKPFTPDVLFRTIEKYVK